MQCAGKYFYILCNIISKRKNNRKVTHGLLFSFFFLLIEMKLTCIVTQSQLVLITNKSALPDNKFYFVVVILNLHLSISVMRL